MKTRSQRLIVKAERCSQHPSAMDFRGRDW